MNFRLLVLIGPIATAAGLLALPLSAAAAPTPSPSPSPQPVKTVQISGDGLSKPIVIASDRDPQRQAAVRAEVDWLANQPGVTQSPPADKLGPMYTVVLSTDGKPLEKYELYPLAVGGPRAYRPADQPDERQVAEGWFYGRLSMPTTLIAAGVPMDGVPLDPGGEGGGALASEPPDLEGMLGSWRNFMGLNLAVVIVVAAGVFALAYVLRRQV